MSPHVAPATAPQRAPAQRGAVSLSLRYALTALLATLIAAPAAAPAEEIDTATSRIGFTIRTRWGQTLEGTFPRYTGQIELLGEGRERVRLQLSTKDVEIIGNASYTRLTRGSGFFDAERYPTITFESDPYTEPLLRSGGELAGTLDIRGIRRREMFTIEPAACDKPGVRCDVVASGSVDRNDYGIDRWGFAIGSRVVFKLRVRVLPPAPAAA